MGRRYTIKAGIKKERKEGISILIKTAKNLKFQVHPQVEIFRIVNLRVYSLFHQSVH